MKMRANFYLALFTILLTSVFFALSLGQQQYWFFLWLIPLPAMLYCQRASLRSSIFVALIAYVSGCTTVIFHRYLYSVYPIPFALIPSLIHGMAFTLIIVLYRICLDRIPAWLSVLVFPACWTAYQIVWTYTNLSYFIHFGIGTQAYFLPMLQLASITGMWGISFAVSVFASSIATAFYFFRQPVKMFTSLLVGTVIIGGSLAFGYYRLDHKQDTRKIKVTLVAFNPKHMRDIGYPTQKAMQLRIDNFAPLLKQLTQQNPLFILTSEIWLQLNDNNTLSTLKMIKNTAKKKSINVIAAIKLLGSEMPKTNSAWVINQQGELVGQYNKIHLIPEIENNLVAGHDIRTHTLNGVKLGIAIGSDPTFQQPIHDYGKLSGQIVFISSADNGIDHSGRDQRQISILHAVGNGLAMARTASFGELTITDPYGQIIANMQGSKNTISTVTATVSLGFGNTFHSRHGNWFFYVCFAIMLLIGLALLLSKRGAAVKAHR